MVTTPIFMKKGLIFNEYILYSQQEIADFLKRTSALMTNEGADLDQYYIGVAMEDNNNYLTIHRYYDDRWRTIVRSQDRSMCFSLFENLNRL